jgi:VHL beta domain
MARRSLLAIIAPVCVAATSAVAGGGDAQAMPRSASAAAACVMTQDRSTASTNATTIEFINQTAGTVSVYWLDFDGNRRFWFNLRSGRSQPQSTFSGHAWVVLDAAGTCVGFVVGAHVHQRYVISTGTAPQPPPPPPAPPPSVTPPPVVRPNASWASLGCKGSGLRYFGAAAGNAKVCFTLSANRRRMREHVFDLCDSARLAATPNSPSRPFTVRRNGRFSTVRGMLVAGAAGIGFVNVTFSGVVRGARASGSLVGRLAGSSTPRFRCSWTAQRVSR